MHVVSFFKIPSQYQIVLFKKLYFQYIYLLGLTQVPSIQKLLY